jgi:hypothetical protein
MTIAAPEMDQDRIDRVAEQEREFLAALQDKSPEAIDDDDIRYLEAKGWVLSRSATRGGWIGSNPDLQLYTAKGLVFGTIGEVAYAAAQVMWAVENNAAKSGIATDTQPTSADESSLDGQIDSAITRLFNSSTRNTNQIADLKRNGANDQSLVVFLKSYVGKRGIVESKDGPLVSITSGTPKAPGFALYFNRVGVGEPAIKGRQLVDRIRKVLVIPTTEEAAARQAETKAEEAAGDIAVEVPESIPDVVDQSAEVPPSGDASDTDEANDPLYQDPTFQALTEVLSDPDLELSDEADDLDQPDSGDPDNPDLGALSENEDAPSEEDGPGEPPSDGKDAGVWYDEGPQAIVNVPTMEQWEKSFEKEPETAPAQPSLFDYSALDSETRIVVQQRAVEIKSLVKQTTTAICDIGGKLAEVKARLKHGQWLPWLEREFDWSSQTAARFMQVHDRFAQIQHRDEFQKLDLSALYLLAAPSAPEGATVEALARAESGERITKPVAEEIVDRYKADEVAAQPELPGAEVQTGLITGVCRTCGCTEDEPCAVYREDINEFEGCAWVDGTDRTLCSNCEFLMASNGWDETNLRSRIQLGHVKLPEVEVSRKAENQLIPESESDDDEETGTALERLEARGWKFLQNDDDQRWFGTNEISGLKTSSYAKLERAVESAVSLQREGVPAPRRVEPDDTKQESDPVDPKYATLTTPEELAAYLQKTEGLKREELLKLGVMNTVIEQALAEKLIYKSRLDETYKAERVQPEASKGKGEPKAPAKPSTSSTPVVGPEPVSMKRVSDARENFERRLNRRPLTVALSFMPGVLGKINVSVRVGNDPTQTRNVIIASSDIRLPMTVLDLISERIDAADKGIKPEPARATAKKTVKRAPARPPAKKAPAKPAAKATSRKPATKSSKKKGGK